MSILDNILFELILQRTNSDKSCNYYVKLKKECKLGEFIKEWLRDEKQYGVFVIEDTNFSAKFKNGEYTQTPFPKYLLSNKVQKVTVKRAFGDSTVIIKLKSANK
jgi:hypothetical protein